MSQYFKHSAQNTTNSHPHFNQRKRMGRQKKIRITPGARNKEKKTGVKLKENNLVR